VILAIIQARMGSSRLPGKVMMDLCGKPALGHVATRVSQAKIIIRRQKISGGKGS
jgi:spore coat polysaccharide biosynthesis protein SpsF